jgi:hypothetical protein
MANEEPKEIKITNVNPSVHEDLKNISKNQGISMAALIKPSLRSLADSFPPEMKKPRD